MFGGHSLLTSGHCSQKRLEVRRFREGKKVLEGQSYSRVEEAGTKKKDLDNPWIVTERIAGHCHDPG